MKAFLVSWYASGYCGTFRYMVVANNLDKYFSEGKALEDEIRQRLGELKYE